MSIVESATRHLVTIRRWTTTGSDDRGNPTGTPTDVTNVPVRMSQHAEAELAGEEAVVGRWFCYLRPDTTLEEVDQVLWDGKSFEVKTVVDYYGWDGRSAYRLATLHRIG